MFAKMNRNVWNFEIERLYLCKKIKFQMKGQKFQTNFAEVLNKFHENFKQNKQKIFNKIFVFVLIIVG